MFWITLKRAGPSCVGTGIGFDCLYGLTESEFTHIPGTFPLVAVPVKAAALAAFLAGG